MKAVGLMSGTSMDGIDAALVEIEEGETGTSPIRLLAFRTDPYRKSLRFRLLSLAGGEARSVAEVCHLNVYLGELFAQSVLRVLDEAGVSPEAVSLIGSHGQTVHHLPKPRKEYGMTIRSTLQIGEPSVIADRTGITTVADFRHRDMAAGGGGAPLVPYVHDFLFRHPNLFRGILNIGGMANLSYLPAGKKRSDLLAFDTGPGNVLIDGLIEFLSAGRLQMDRKGKLASKGRVHRRLLSRWMRHPFFQRPPPKSTGREEFGPSFLKKILGAAKQHRMTEADLAATVSALTTETIVQGVRRFILSRGPLDELYVGGGGRFNLFFLDRLAEGLAPIRVSTFEALGCSSKAFEAMAFAFLAYETLHGKPCNVPSVTGARYPVLLGKIVPGSYSVSTDRSCIAHL